MYRKPTFNGDYNEGKDTKAYQITIPSDHYIHSIMSHPINVRRMRTPQSTLKSQRPFLKLYEREKEEIMVNLPNNYGSGLT